MLFKLIESYWVNFLSNYDSNISTLYLWTFIPLLIAAALLLSYVISLAEPYGELDTDDLLPLWQLIKRYKRWVICYCLWVVCLLMAPTSDQMRYAGFDVPVSVTQETE